MDVRSACKVNLSLKVGARRPDGYHEVESLMLALNLCDTVSVEDAAGDTGSASCALEMDTSGLPPPLAAPLEALSPESNLVMRAAAMFCDCVKMPASAFRYKITKRIPAGSGLGGASGDAAAALFALNKLCSSPFTETALACLGAQIGSDVPFFVHSLYAASPYAALAKGRGEHIERLPLPPPVTEQSVFVIIHPGFPSPTAEAYRELDERRDLTAERAAGIYPESPPDFCENRHSLFYNSFLQYFVCGPHGAEYRDMLDALRGEGAVFASLTGSGSACFGLYTGAEAAEAAAANLASCGRWPFVRTAGVLL